MAVKKNTTTPKTVSIKDYEKATYKTELSLFEYESLITPTVIGIVNLYDQGIYGFNHYIMQTALVKACTNIKVDNSDMDVLSEFYSKTNVIEKIREALGSELYRNILNDIDLGVRYRISTNPDVKGLLAGLADLVSNLTKSTESLSDETVAELRLFAENAFGTVKKDADK